MPDDTERLNLLIGLRRYADAEKAAREAIARDPNWGPGYTHLARALINLNRADDAIEAAREGVRKAPKDAWAVGTLACAMNWFNRPKEAIGPAEEAVRLDPTYAWAYAMLANLYFNLNRFQDARRTATDGMKYDPESESLFRWKGWAEHSLKRYRDALATAEAGVKKHPNSHLLLNLLGRVKWSLAERKWFRGRLALHREADAALAEAVRLNPAEPSYRSNWRDNAVSARGYILRIVLPVLAVFFCLFPTLIFTAVAARFVTEDSSVAVPLVFAAVVVVATRLPEMSTAAALTAPLDRFRLPTVPLEPGDRRQGLAEWCAYLIFFLSPYGAMVWVLAKAWG